MEVEGWIMRHYPVVDSTNLVAAGLGAWHAVRADRQTAGRGRFQRSWISDEGGLWLSAVLPLPRDRADRAALPLVVGLAVWEALHSAGVKGLRMRWPNDLLVENRKLAGVLLDQFAPGLAVAGIGINVANRPEVLDASLRNRTVRLADLLPGSLALDVSHWTTLLLTGLRRMMDRMGQGGFNALLPRINQLWGSPRCVELDLDGATRRGMFSRVDAAGRLVLTDETGTDGFAVFHAHEVRCLTELESI
jgi:BirA family biotin operon repressor/biotin-[acetyl-CoA-carboxylase] ligase